MINGRVHQSQLDSLTNWYGQQYVKFKGYQKATARRVAEELAWTAINNDCSVPANGHIGNLQGIMGEILTGAALNLIAPQGYVHKETHRELDNLGMDLRVLSYKLIMGLGVKLNKTLPPVVRELPQTHQCLPVVHLRVRPESIGLQGILEQQRNGILVDPSSYVAEVFQDSGVYQEFRGALQLRCQDALTRGIGSDFPDAGTYLTSFIQ